jgi:hypothetical protein
MYYPGSTTHDENDRKLEEILKRLSENFEDFMKLHKHESANRIPLIIIQYKFGSRIIMH